MASEIITDTSATTEDMELEITKPEEEKETLGKREREEPENDAVLKKRKVEEEEEEEEGKEEKSVEEVRMEKEEKENVGPVGVGPKTFETSSQMFDYFYKFLHKWPINIAVNKYEYLVLLDLIKKGHPEPDKKIGSGINAFEIRYHPTYQSRCFFVVREDKSVEDFSFRKCVDQILPLPENMKIKSDVNKVLGGGKKGGGGGGGGGRRGGGRGGGHGGGRGWGRGGRSRK